MRVRRASTRARRPTATRSLSTLALVSLVGTGLVASGANAVATPPATDPNAGGPGAAPTPDVVAQDSAGLRVTDVGVPRVSTADAAALSASRGIRDQGAGRLVAHLRKPLLHRFSMLGVTWDHRRTPADVTVEVRTRSTKGWTPWSVLDDDPDGGPSSAEQDGSLRDGTEAVWVGDASGVEVAVYGSRRTGAAPRGLEVSTIDPGRSPAAYNAIEAQKTTLSTGKPGSFPTIPRIITRKQWGADPSLGDECWDPKYGRTFKAVIVHHTAGSNDYTKNESAAIVRGILAYHTQARGWCDIGYNFLVDRFGQVFEGRAGGIRRPVRGAHSGDYNVNTTGVSLMGNFDTAYPTKAMKASLIKLIAWRLGTAYHGALGKPYVFDRRIDRISGHRDVMSTACPGQHVYDWLPRLRRLVNERLGNWSSAIEKRWERTRGKAGDLGVVTIGEQKIHGGRFTAFTHGRVYVSRFGMRTMYQGPMLQAYLRADGPVGPLGYPKTRAWRVSETHGLAQEFASGRIYWSQRSGAHALREGAVLHKYRSVGAAAGRLGFPTSRVVDLKHGSKATFQHGSIRHNTLTHSTTVRYR